MSTTEIELDINERKTYVMNEVTALLGTDWPDHLAQRLDYTNAAALAGALKKWGRNDLAMRLNRAEWDGLTSDARRTAHDKKKGAQW